MLVDRVGIVRLDTEMHTINSKNKPIPARLHVLLARDEPYGLVIRRGPSKHVCTIGWDRTTDDFQIGQWLKGRIYERRSDLSPNGQHFIYFAMNGKWDSETKGSWTAVSQTPYLKAVGLWGKGDCWHGGGLFVRNRRYWVNAFDNHFTVTDAKTFNRDDQHDRQYEYGGECPGVYYIRLQRDGWKYVSRDERDKLNSVHVFEKHVSEDWLLRKIAHGTCYEREPGKGVYYDEHALVNTNTDEELKYPDWEWADVDRDRMVWCEKGKLYAGSVNGDGLSHRSELNDFNTMEFEPLPAPY